MENRNITVAVRVRPMLSHEVLNGHKSTHIFSDSKRNELMYFHH